jgi:hypothetical protein
VDYVFKMKVLFWFHGDDFDLFEIKRTHLIEEKDPSKIYQWFMLTKYQLIKLDFLEMSSDYRKFKNAQFSFNKESGNLKMGPKTYQLKKQDPELANPFIVFIEKKLDVLIPLQHEICL